MKQNTFLPVAMICLLALPWANQAMADDEKDDEKDSDGRNCIQTRTLKSTAVVDDYNVLFVRKGNSVYHNILPRECKGLSRYKMFSYVTTSGSLCRQDIIQVINAQGRELRGCPLGTFYEITTDELRTLVENSQKAAAKKDESEKPD